jgi:uncharacterized protein YhhL (DUF1145 family)
MKTTSSLIRYVLLNLDAAIWGILLWAFWIYPWVAELQWAIMVWAFINIMLLKIRIVVLISSLQAVSQSGKELSAVLKSIQKRTPTDHHPV